MCLKTGISYFGDDMTAFDIEKTQEILKHFYKLTKIKICVFDCNGIEIAYYPKKHMPICEYISSSPNGCELCNLSVENAFQACRNEKKRIIYTCDMGLIECVSPIMHNGVVIGYVMLGQTRDRKEPDISLLKQISEKCGLNSEKLIRLFSQIRYNSRSAVESASKIMEACASYIYMYGLVDIDETDLQLRLNRYITENLTEELSVDKLCRAFGLSRTAIYKLFHKFYGTTVQQFIFKKRISRATELLKNSSDSISDIAAAVGIKDYNYFIRSFRKEIGISPLQFRKKNTHYKKPSDKNVN